MSETVIKIENLSKQYRLGLVGTGTISHDLNRWWAKVRGKEDPALKIGSANQLDTVDGEFIWALKDINFEVKRLILILRCWSIFACIFVLSGQIEEV